MQYKGKSLCPNCFAQTKENINLCPVCGYEEGQGERFPIALPQGTILLGKYVIGKILGKGGFGITYLAFDLTEGKTVAVKEYLPDSLIHRNTGDTLVSTYYGDKEEAFKTGAEKFYEEAKTIARFNGHPNIIHVSEFFYENNTAYFVMEYINGVDLKTYVAKKGGRLSEGETLRILAPLLDALASVHAVGVLHRDISPDNIFVTDDGTVKLLDFGSARQVLGEQSKSLSVVLKPGFAPIEQYQTRGKQGEWTDIYALAATMYYCLTGQVPEASMDRVVEDCLTPPSALFTSVSPQLEAVLLKAMSVLAIHRIQDVGEFREALGTVPLFHARPEVTAEHAVRIADISLAADAAKKSDGKNREEPFGISDKLKTVLRNKKNITAGVAVCAILIFFVCLIAWNTAGKKPPVATGGRLTEAGSSTVSSIGSTGSSLSSSTVPSASSTAGGTSAPSQTSGVVTVSPTVKPPVSSEASSSPAAPSGDGSLKALTVPGYSLTPAFSSGNFDYSLTVGGAVSSIQVSAAANQSGASVKVSGPVSRLSAVQTNTVTVSVTAPSGNVKTYTIHVTRKNEYYKDPAINNSNLSIPIVLVPKHMEYQNGSLIVNARIYNNTDEVYTDVNNAHFEVYDRMLDKQGVPVHYYAKKDFGQIYSGTIPAKGYVDVTLTLSGSDVINPNGDLTCLWWGSDAK